MALRTYKTYQTAQRGLMRARMLHPQCAWFIIGEPNGFRYALAYTGGDGKRPVYLAR